MSLARWKRYYYPITAEEAARKDVVAAIEHSLKKWRGLRKNILLKHNLRKAHLDSRIEDIDGFHNIHINESTCALCIYAQIPYALDYCKRCPIVLITGTGCCDNDRDHLSAYSAFIDYNDPEPMIELLEKCLKKYSKRRKNRK